jgi:hypothetical protein
MSVIWLAFVKSVCVWLLSICSDNLLCTSSMSVIFIEKYRPCTCLSVQLWLATSLRTGYPHTLSKASFSFTIYKKNYFESWPFPSPVVLFRVFHLHWSAHSPGLVYFLLRLTHNFIPLRCIEYWTCNYGLLMLMSTEKTHACKTFCSAHPVSSALDLCPVARRLYGCLTCV